MFCPKCGDEYREEYTECAECKVPLVAELPEKTERKPITLVPVVRTSDAALIPLIKSILDDARINFHIKGEGIQDIFALGRVGGINPLTGPAEISVAKSNVSTTKKLLADIEGIEGQLV